MNDLICYCFEHTSEDIRQDFLTHGHSMIMEKIKAAKKMGSCQCTTKNPKGKWCLPDVRQVVDNLAGRAHGLKDNNQPKNIVTLDGSLNPLKLRFNNDKEKIRFLALLSPTCPLWRDQGARAVQEIIIGKFPDADIAASIVWIPILNKDSLEAALPSIKNLSDKRFQHFYDKDQIVGKEIAKSIGWDGHVAWDIYLFYAPYTEWNNVPPAPKRWMHQLKDSWAHKEHFHRGDDLIDELSNAVRALSGEV